MSVTRLQFSSSKSQQENRQDLEAREEGEGKWEGCWLCRNLAWGTRATKERESHASDPQPDTHPHEPVRRDSSRGAPATAFQGQGGWEGSRHFSRRPTLSFGPTYSALFPIPLDRHK